MLISSYNKSLEMLTLLKKRPKKTISKGTKTLLWSNGRWKKKGELDKRYVIG